MTAAEDGNETTVRSCKIVAESLYTNGPVAEVTVTVTSIPTGIGNMFDNGESGDIDFDAPDRSLHPARRTGIRQDEESGRRRLYSSSRQEYQEAPGEVTPSPPSQPIPQAAAPSERQPVL